MFGSLDGNLMLPLALGALQPQHQLLSCLCLLPENRLGLTTESLLLTIIPTSSLSLLRLGRFLVLGHLELLVSVALPAVCAALFGDVDHPDFSCRSESSNISLTFYIAFDCYYLGTGRIHKKVAMILVKNA